MADGSGKTAKVKIVPLQFLKAVLPNPQDLGENYDGETSIGCRIRGKKDGFFRHGICGCNNFFNNILIIKSSMNQYETVFILTPVLSDEQMKETVAKFKKLLTDNGAEILNEEAWGLKKLAYNIEKKTSGFYNLIEFKAEPTLINKLETGYRRDEKVIRYMTVKLEKYAAQYAEKRRAKLGKKEEA